MDEKGVVGATPFFLVDSIKYDNGERSCYTEIKKICFSHLDTFYIYLIFN